jgi:hypothetical protein
MKYRLGVLSVIAVCATLVGCVTVPTAQSDDVFVAVDQVKVERIERAARQVGLRVYWFNKPTIEVRAAKS